MNAQSAQITGDFQAEYSAKSAADMEVMRQTAYRPN
jgi:hypothetical protein